MKENVQTHIAIYSIATGGTMVSYFITCLGFILLNLACYESGNAQVKPGDFFIVNSMVKVLPVTDFSISKKGDEARFYFAIADQKFTVTDVSEDGFIQIKFWDFKDTMNTALKIDSVLTIKNLSTGKNKGVNKKNVPDASLTRSSIVEFSDEKILIDKHVNGKVFTISLKDLNEKCMPYFGRKFSFTFGAMTIPLKIRVGSETTRRMLVEEKLNIGLTPGLKYQIPSRKEQSITFMANIGVSTARTTADTFNSGYKSSSNNEPALSGALGFMYQYEKFQIAILSGQDWLLSDGSKNWKYQGKRWVGIGIGFFFFGKGEVEANPGKN